MRKLKWLRLYLVVLAIGWQVPIQAQIKASNSSQKPQTIPTCFDLSWDGNLVLTGGKNGYLKLWGVQEGQLLKTYDSVTEKNEIKLVAFSPSGKHCFAYFGYWVALPMVLETHAGKVIQGFKKQGFPVFSLSTVAFSRDETKLLAKKCELEVGTGKVVKKPYYFSSNQTAMVLSPDGAYLLTNGGGKKALLWNHQHGEFVNAFIGHSQEVSAVNFSKNGQRVLSAASDVKMWDTKIGRLLKTFKSTANDPLRAVMFSPDQAQIWATTNEQCLFWDVATGKLINTINLEGATIQKARLVNNALQILTTTKERSEGQIWKVTPQQKQLVQKFDFTKQ